MFILIQDGNELLRVEITKNILPFKYRGIEIVDKSGHLYICLNKGFFFSDRDKVRKLEQRKYVIKTSDLISEINLFVYSDSKGIDDYKLYNNEPFLYISSPKANIENKDLLLKEYYLMYKDHKLKTNAPVLLLNGKAYSDEELCSGDFVSFYNFSFYYYDDFLYINNFLVENRIKEKQLDELSIIYENVKPLTHNYLLNEPKIIEIPEIKKYNELRKIKQKPLVYQIGPSLTMSLAMIFVASINVYKNYLDGNDLTNSLVYMIMPFMMVISGVLWPILTRLNESRTNNLEIKREKEAYLDYLVDYKTGIQNNIREVLKERNTYFFDGEFNDEKLFYITNKSPLFLNLSLGFVEYDKHMKLNKTSDDDINETLNSINYGLTHIEKYPYFLDLKNYHLISIVANKNRLNYLLKKFLLELSVKYHYDDYYVALYSKDLDEFNEFFNIPSIIYHDSRLTLREYKELQELNNLKLDKPLVLMANSRLDYHFTNPNIILMYFVEDENNIYKDSESVVYFKDNKGIIKGKEEYEFTYNEKAIDFKDACELLSDYQKIRSDEGDLTFKEVFNNFDIESFYTQKQVGLRADFAYMGRELLYFDLDERNLGPHGLIAGTTGSGKSELIVSMLLSLCIRYRPDYLNIILIDYKGGGIKESLTSQKGTIPHIVGSIDNLEPSGFERMIVALDHECKRRQTLFKKLSNKLMTSIMNIDDYLDSDYQNFGFPKMAHLLIVVDEFAQLKKDNPTIIKELISFSRIGRSLGVHLILATQRPSGAIDDEIWSNSRFKIALKVLSEKDSNDIIKRKDAAYLTEAGQFYLSVDENIYLAKSFYSKKDIDDKDDYEVSLLDNRLNVISKKSYKQQERQTIASYVTNKIIDTTRDMNIEVTSIDFKKPQKKEVIELRNEYKKYDEIVFGQIDDYRNHYKDILTIGSNENIFICSSRSNEINTILNQINRKTIVIASKKYKGKYISDSLVYEEIDDIVYLFKKLKKSNEELTLVIEDYNCLSAYDDSINESLISLLKRSEVTHVNAICLTKVSTMNFRLLNSFKHKLVIEYKDKQDLLNVFSSSNFDLNDSFYNGQYGFIPCLINELDIEESQYPSYVDYIPDTLEFESSNKGILAGFDIKNRDKVYFNVNKKVLITGNDQELIDYFSDVYKTCENVKVCLYDSSLKDKDYDEILWLRDGLFKQRLFYYDEKEDLKDNYAYYLKGNKGRVLKTIAYE